MNNMKDKFNNQFSKVQGEIDKGREKVELMKEKSNVSRDINEAQIKKTNILLEMGELVYEKIRRSNIIDGDFDMLCSQIVELDKFIYSNNMKAKELDVAEKDIICECGNTLDKSAKFCAECGKKVEVELINDNIKNCFICESEIDADCKYCVCCGSKII